jgi:NDP-sugar pyrophosphorylase family protein
MPKSMVRLLGKPIIEYTMEALAKRRVSELIIVVGYCKDAIKEYFRDNYKGIPIRYVDNKDYESTNNIYSLKLGLMHVSEDLILCEGDVAVRSDIS